MEGEPAELPSDPDQLLALLQRQMARLKRCFEWERWLLEPRSFAPPDDLAPDDLAPDDLAEDDPESRS